MIVMNHQARLDTQINPTWDQDLLLTAVFVAPSQTSPLLSGNCVAQQNQHLVCE